jgi:hypothetical protein
VARFKDGEVLKYDLTGFGIGGAPFVYHDEVYWRRGREHGDNGPSLWRWNDSKFVRLSEREASLLDHNKIKDIDTTTRPGGWNQQTFQTGWDHPEVTIRLRNGSVRVYAEKQSLTNGRNDRVRVMLAEHGNTNSAKILIDVVEGYKKISKAEYLKLRLQKSDGNQ